MDRGSSRYELATIPFMLYAGRGPSGNLWSSLSQLQKKFKHAKDFGVLGKWSAETARQFGQAIENLVDSPATTKIVGTYRGKPAIHHVDPETGLNVITDSAGKFISGWKLSAEQLRNVLTRGSL